LPSKTEILFCAQRQKINFLKKTKPRHQCDNGAFCGERGTIWLFLNDGKSALNSLVNELSTDFSSLLNLYIILKVLKIIGS